MRVDVGIEGFEPRRRKVELDPEGDQGDRVEGIVEGDEGDHAARDLMPAHTRLAQRPVGEDYAARPGGGEAPAAAG